MGLVSARLDDLRDLLDGEGEFLVHREEVRAEAKADAGPRIADDLSLAELFMHGLELGRVDDERPAPALRAARRQDLETGALEQASEELGLMQRVRADRVDADLFDEVVARRCGVQGGNVRRPRQEPGCAVRVLEL